MRSLDTTAAAHDAQIRAYRRMGSEARVCMAFELSDSVRRIALEGIRSRHPEYSDERARRELFRLLLGDDLAQAIWPGEAPVAP